MKDKQIVIRATAADRDQWERWASERGMTVSDLARVAVTAFVRGDAGIPFAPTCPSYSRHIPGRTCPACGGSARPAA
jgi:hypothetical protein